ncbi:MAG TPA: NADH-quinone oxidoreductase subunit L [Acidimicrobiia bacterium]|nr:NADH-quinone oxidoreductase subunit L [Acidimicrobiia bacterium]
MMHSLTIFAAEESARSVGDGGWWADTAGIMLVLPFVAFGLILVFGKHLKHKGGEIAVGALAINLVWATVLFVANMTGGVLDQTTFEIARIGSDLVFELGWVVDGLSIMMYFLVNLVGLLVFIYALGYMKGDVRVPWFFAAFSMFAGAMLILVGAPNLVQMIIGWEGVGLASYFLIGFYWDDLDNVKAGNKAFMTNKVADVGLILGAVILGVTIGSFDFFDLAEAASSGAEALGAVAVVGGLLLFFGAMGKSAQFPLHIWLPDAMAGPTPVSALMHAATMVTASIYLMARTFPLFQNMAQEARGWMVAIGAITLFAIGLLALVADDIKKVLAYSTVSQLGYMMTAVAAGGYTAGLFHLFTHAFFKALLFLGAGSVIHAVHSNNMSDMGGLRKYMPTTYWTFVVGSLALAGIVPLSGFWSKDEILASLGY